ncbi:uncharacterized protein EV420DRAFT_1643732 [Desarmillaria tabescens]|uniref:Uncharacterized protein n=1 Tax=Armillaria tabescens TaxID=1929756 RepID=A0AA39KDP1_ARMTA|nr:uncharacterized protein EV420DRAFT_1643732 [Desarmillaria tabescens]KAK0457884.1 hypothetical protein EV420DRAFT_1643732 [Desarmillaria tabescens]
MAMSTEEMEAMKRYEKLERELAIEFGLAGDGTIDETEVMAAAKLRLIQMEEDLQRFRAKVQNLHELQCLRSKFAALDKVEQIVMAILVYFNETLQIPPERMQLLLDPSDGNTTTTDGLEFQDPARKNTIDTLAKLAASPYVTKNEGIILYYSGHGAAYTVSANTYNINAVEVSVSHLDSVEAICPLDRSAGGDTSLPIVPDISSRELHILLRKISLDKGSDNNQAEAGSQTSASVRYTPPLIASPELLSKMLTAADALMKAYPDPDKHEKYSVWTEKWTADTASHVLLAACRSFQLATAIRLDSGDYCGLFTDALLRALKSNEVTADCTFSDLLRAMPSWTDRTPVVRGDRKHEPLWYRRSLPVPPRPIEEQEHKTGGPEDPKKGEEPKTGSTLS